MAVVDNRSGGEGLYSRTRKGRGWNGSVAWHSCLAALDVPEWDDTRALQAEAGWPAAIGGVSEHGAERAAHEGHVVLSPCRLRLSMR
jgi:hypothetical protein